MRRLALLALVAVSVSAYGQLDAEKYLSPTKVIADMVAAPRHLNVTIGNLSPDGTKCIVSQTGGMPTIAQMSKPYLNLGGEMIDPISFRDRALVYRSAVQLEVRTLASDQRFVVKVEGATLGNAEWSPDGSQIAFLGHHGDRTHLYVVDVASKRVSRVSEDRVNTSLVAKVQWVDQGRGLVAVVVPSGVGKMPVAPSVPDQPLVRVTDPKKTSIRTFRTLLGNTYEKEQFEFFSTGQLVRYDRAKSWRPTTIGQPQMIRGFDASPDGKYFRATTVMKPFSYLVPASSFGQKEELWDESGKVLSEISKRELNTEETAGPRTPREPGKRGLAWRPDGAGMSFLRQEPAPEKKEGVTETAPRKDQVMQWLPPYGEKDVKVIYAQDGRMTSVRYSPDATTLFLGETVSGNEVISAVRLAEPSKKVTISSRKPDDFYGNPGTLISTSNNPWGVDAVRIGAANQVYLSGVQYSKTPDKEAPRPFVDAVDLATGKSSRVWQSSTDVYETFTGFASPAGDTAVIRRESPTTIPNNFLVTLAGGNAKALTANVDYAPDVTNANRYRVQITRADGFKFYADVLTPKWATKGMKLPAMFWFYPDEVKDQKEYDDAKRSYNKNAFSPVGAMSLDYLVSQGYAVVKPDCPIVGTATNVNDNYVGDLRNNLFATIEELDRQGLIDRERLALGGHSYGAFSTVNAMVHTPFFKAGIAGDGNYNRTLTPFAFQSETRKLWEAKSTYQEMSALLYADRLTGALLMYHGMDDQNVGTDPINSIRMFNALEALGKEAALYMYPYEDHGPASRETLLDMWARWTMWLEKYLGKK